MGLICLASYLIDHSFGCSDQLIVQNNEIEDPLIATEEVALKEYPLKPSNSNNRQWEICIVKNTQHHLS